MRIHKTLLAGTMIAAGATVFAAAPALAETIKIGAPLSVTGPASFLGDPEARTLEIYVKQINEAGGVNGKDLELIVYDDAGDANKARTFATRLVEDDEVVAVVGGLDDRHDDGDGSGVRGCGHPLHLAGRAPWSSSIR